MALPVTISGVKVALRNSYHGPFISSGGNVYTILIDSTATGQIEAWKATDPTTSFSNVGTNHTPGGFINSMSVRQVGDNLHVVVQDSNTDAYYSRFNMATDAWDRSGTLIDSGPGATANDNGVDVVVRSDGDIVAVYRGPNHKDMGSNFVSVYYSVSTDSGANWSTGVEVDGGAGVDYRGTRAEIGDSDTTHFVYGGSDQNVYQRALSSADALQTERDTGFNKHSILFPFTRGLSYDRGGTTRLRFGYVEETTVDLEVLRFDAAADPSAFNTDNVHTDDIRGAGGTQSIACLAVDGDTAHALLVKVSDADLYSSDDGAADTWATPVSEFTGTVNHVSCNIYSRSGTKRLAYVMEDAGAAIKYNEIDLSTAVDGDGDQTLAALTQSGSGSQVQAGDGDQTLGALTQAGAGVMVPAGDGAQTLAALTQAGAGAQRQIGDGAQLLAALTQAGDGAQRPAGDGAQLLAAPLQAGQGQVPAQGDGAQLLAAALQAGAAIMVPAGDGAQALAAPLQAGDATQRQIGDGAQLLAAATQAGDGSLRPVADGAQTLAALLQVGQGLHSQIGDGVQLLAAALQAGAAIMVPAGDGAQTFAAPLQAGDATQRQIGDGAQLLAVVTQAGSGTHGAGGGAAGDGAQLLAAVTQAGAAVMRPAGDGAQALAALLQAGQGLHSQIGDGAQLLAAATQTGQGLQRQIGDGAQTLAALTQAGQGNQLFFATGAQLLASLTQAGAGNAPPAGAGVQLLAAVLQAGDGTLIVTAPVEVIELVAVRLRTNVTVVRRNPIELKGIV